MAKIPLPKWAKISDQAPRHDSYVRIEVLASEAFPLYLEKIGVTGDPDQFQISIARRCMAHDLRDLLTMHGLGLELRIKKDPDEYEAGAPSKWRLAHYPRFNEEGQVQQFEAACAEVGIKPNSREADGMLAEFARRSLRMFHRLTDPLVDRAKYQAWFEERDAAGEQPPWPKHPKLLAGVKAYLGVS